MRPVDECLTFAAEFIYGRTEDLVSDSLVEVGLRVKVGWSDLSYIGTFKLTT
jgi:hypothetical protein